MPSSFVTLDFDIDKPIGFWVSDTLFEVVCAYIVLEIEELPQGIAAWVSEMKELIRFNSLGYFPSYMHLDFQKYLINQERTELFLKVIGKTKLRVERGHDTISGQELISLMKGNEDSIWERTDIYKKTLMKAFSFLELLLAGQLKTRVGDRVDYW